MHHSHRERVDGVDERVVGLQLGVVVTDVDELTEKLRRKQHLEQASIALEAEEKAQRAERVRLQVNTQSEYTCTCETRSLACMMQHTE